MANYNHFGSNVCGITSMPFGDQLSYYAPYNTPELYEKFTREIKGLRYKYLFAITANKYQNKCREILEKQNFRQVVNFKSSHVTPETLTLWIKIQKEFDDFSKNPINLPMGNCSVGFTEYERNLNFFLMVNHSNKSHDDLKKEGFKRVRATPIWFKIQDRAKLPKENKTEAIRL